MFLFVVMNTGHNLTPEMRQAIKQAIRSALSPRHVPRFVLQVPEIPTTINGKKVEAAVKQTISGKDVKPSNTVVNPGSLLYYTRFRHLERETTETKL